MLTCILPDRDKSQQDTRCHLRARTSERKRSGRELGSHGAQRRSEGGVIPHRRQVHLLCKSGSQSALAGTNQTGDANKEVACSKVIDWVTHVGAWRGALLAVRRAHQIELETGLGAKAFENPVELM